MRKYIYMAYLGLLLTLTSCASVPVKDNTVTPAAGSLGDGAMIAAPAVIRTDIFHEVAPGDTMWRLSKMYDVNMSDIANANKLVDVNKLEKGQKLIIPHAAPLRPVVPLWSSNKWKYIIIHHSATDVGNALSFDYMHANKRRWKGIGYHFVIDNGTAGKKDGQIEVSPRWNNQEDGAHCKAGSMNCRGIGICLVGNFNTDTVTQKQMDSLLWLVDTLRKQYNVSDSNILGHRDVSGAATDCPGLKFPWVEFKQKLFKLLN